MNNQNNEALNSILEIYKKFYYPKLELVIRDIRKEKDRFYLIHDGNDVVISLLPPLKNNDSIGKQDL